MATKQDNPILSICQIIVDQSIWSMEESDILANRNALEKYLETLKEVTKIFDKGLNKARENDENALKLVTHFRKPRNSEKTDSVDLTGLQF